MHDLIGHRLGPNRDKETGGVVAVTNGMVKQDDKGQDREGAQRIAEGSQ